MFKFYNGFSIETASSCNLHCVMCPRRGFKPTNHIMNDAIFNKIIDFIKEHPMEEISMSGIGEPLCDPQFLTRLRQVRKILPRAHISFVTNACKLTPETSMEIKKIGVNSMNISFDGSCANTYEKIRIGGDFATTIENIKSFVKLAPAVKLSVTCTVSKDVYPEMEECVLLLISCGIKEMCFSDMFMVCTTEQRDYYVDKNLVKSRAIALNHKYKNKIKIYEHDNDDEARNNNRGEGCGFSAPHHFWISSEGVVAPCPNLCNGVSIYDREMKDAKSTLMHFGDLATETLPEILEKPKVTAFVEHLKFAAAPPLLCGNCPCQGFATRKELILKIDRLLAERITLQNSMSMKITKPLRAVAALLRKK